MLPCLNPRSFFAYVLMRLSNVDDGIAEFARLEFAGLENDALENDGVEQEETYILHTMKRTQTNVYDT